ncbi:hypothetical protein L3Q65_17135 [Amycolatopsis sp. FU40]|uniref:hypothetical protein n=1 Tax=Amycolatopsis sp. FU40 TaxID=2914159 RepID=UPI001F2EE62F|nr:hypothetical protein [Amycolatopsis sp. FU40]UKD58377.1 hypothetical protein L3Q65_17135 [Amycolatopsis sp. FU40]
MDAASWQGPPREVLGQIVPIQQFVARTDRVAAALHYAVVFPEGCLLALHLAIRRGSLDDPAWESVAGNDFDYVSGPQPGAGGLKVGVRFPGGSRATTVEHAFPGWAHPTDRPEGPMLVEAGGDAASSDQYYDRHQRLWLWPLPPPGPFEFVAEWPDLGIDLTYVTLDGNAVVRAAEHAVPLWG